MTTEQNDVQGPVHEAVSASTVGLLARAEIDQQISTAKTFPRSLSRFQRECVQMVTLNADVADECIYALPRQGKTIEGPSARLAEIVASAWGNCRAGARIVDEGAEFVTAQGFFFDVERNVAITYEVRRRITDRNGHRYNADMIGVTANAACSIALRNAVFKGVPKAFWSPAYESARNVVMGSAETLTARRDKSVQWFARLGVTEAQVLAKIGRDGMADVTQEDLLTLRGLATSIKDGETTVEDAFPPVEAKKDAPPEKSGMGGLRASLAKSEPAGGSPTLARLQERLIEVENAYPGRRACVIDDGVWFVVGAAELVAAGFDATPDARVQLDHLTPEQTMRLGIFLGDECAKAAVK